MGTESGIPFGNYTLLKRIARGGMAEVFLARQKGLEGFDRFVAVKRILPHLVDDQDFVRMFLDEARLAARLSHPNIIHIYDFGKVEEHYFIGMEFMVGVHAGDLIRLAATQSIPDTLVARIGADACAGLHYAHERQDELGRPLELVHRDVSPPNLLVSNDGVVKLVDFGIAKAVSSIGQTRPGVVKGKYAYMSPEQTTGKPLDGRSDVFSLALVLWEILAGRTAVTRNDQILAMKTIRDGKVPPIESVRPTTPPTLARALKHALATRKEDRADARQFGQELEAFIKSSRELGSNMDLGHWIRESFPQEPLLSQNDLGPGTRPSTQATDAISLALDPPSQPEASRGSVVARLDTFGQPREVSAASGDLQARKPSDFDEEDPTRALGGPSVMVEGLPTPPELFTSVTAALTPAALRADRGSSRQRRISDLPGTDVDDSPTVESDRRIAIAPPEPFESTRSIQPARRTSKSQRAMPVARMDEPVGDARPADLSDALFPAKSPVVRTATPRRERPEAPPPRPPPTVDVRSDKPTTEDLASPALLPMETPPAGIQATQPARKWPWVLATLTAAGLVVAAVFLAQRADEQRQALAAAPDGGAARGGKTARDTSVAKVPEVVPPILVTPLLDAGVAEQRTALEVLTTPSDAEVFVDGFVARAPVTFAQLAPGKHVVTVFHKRHRIEEREIELEAGKHRDIEVELRPLARRQKPTRRPQIEIKKVELGTLEARTKPFSTVYHGPLKLGVTPLQNVVLTPGVYELTFQSSKGQSARKMVTIEAGKTATVDFELE